MHKPFNSVDRAVTAYTSANWVFYYLFVETDNKNAAHCYFLRFTIPYWQHACGMYAGVFNMMQTLWTRCERHRCSMCTQGITIFARWFEKYFLDNVFILMLLFIFYWLGLFFFLHISNSLLRNKVYAFRGPCSSESNGL